MEIWKDIQGLEGKYQVSNTGLFRSLDHFVNMGQNINRISYGKILVQIKGKDGYFYIAFGRRNRLSSHRTIAQHFIPNPENKPQVNHINCIKTDNRVENLEWCTNKENVGHYNDNFRTNIRNCPKLTEDDVRYIRKSDLPIYVLMAKYNVCRKTIYLTKRLLRNGSVLDI